MKVNEKLAPPFRKRRGGRRVLVAAVTSALAATLPGTAGASSDVRAGVPDLADRVAALRQLLTEKGPSTAVETGFSDRIPAPGTKLSQWKKWKNG